MNKPSSLIGDQSKIGKGNSLANLNRINDTMQTNQSDPSGNVTIDPTRFEYIITDMWSQMKNLEGKYIDLANFYKQEMVQNGRNPGAAGSDAGSSQQSAVSGVVQSTTALTKNNQQENLNLNEDKIINDLKNEKIQFEQHIKWLLDDKTRQNAEQGIMMSNEELARFNNELQAAFKDILDTLEQNSIHAVNNLGQRQTEMFQLATKYKLASGFKNDAIGVWYDAKASITQQMTQLKHFISEKGNSVISQCKKPSSEYANQLDPSKKQDYKALLLKFEEDMIVLRRNTKEYSKNIVALQANVKGWDDAVKKDKQLIKTDFQALIDSVVTTNDILAGRQSLLDGQNLNLESQKSAPSLKQVEPARQSPFITAQSNVNPFDKKIGNYVKGAMQRSNSRGPEPKSRPPKNIENNSGRTSPFRTVMDKTSSIPQNINWNSDLREIKNKLFAYENTVNSMLNNHIEKENKINEILTRYDNQIQNQVLKFLNTHDIEIVKQYFTNTVLTPTEAAQIVIKAQAASNATPALKSSTSAPKRANGSSVSPMRKTTPTRGGKTMGRGMLLSSSNTPSKTSAIDSNFNVTGETNGLQNLAQNTDNLFLELRKTNDKYVEQQVENRRLKDQVQLLSLQIEDFRLQNQRMQQQQAAANPSRVGMAYKKTRTQRPSGSSAQDMVSPSRKSDNGAISERDELAAEEIDLCKKIDGFFQAMKLLQRAVNKKEDISDLKVEFETKQRSLQKMSKNIQTRPQPSVQRSRTMNNSGMTGYQKTTNNSQNRLLLKGPTNNSSSHRLTSSPMARGAGGSFRPKSGTRFGASPKVVKSSSRQGSNRPVNNSNMTDSSFVSQEQSDTIKTQKAQLIKYDQQLMKATSQVQALQANSRATLQQRDQLQRQVVDYQDLIMLIEDDIKNETKEITKSKQTQLMTFINTLKEELKKQRHPLPMSSPSSTPAIGDVQNSNALVAIKNQLYHKIKTQEQALLQQYNALNMRLGKREQEVSQIKKLFVEKLRELETNFAEIGDHLINQNQGIEESNNKLRESGGSLLNNYLTEGTEAREQDEKEREELLQANNDLNDHITSLKNRYKDCPTLEEHQIILKKHSDLTDQLQNHKDEFLGQNKKLQTLTKERDLAVLEHQKAKKEKQNLSIQHNALTELQQKQKLDFEDKEMMIEQSLKNYQAKLKDEIDQRISFEKESRDNKRLVKLQEEENENMVLQIEELEMDQGQLKHILDESSKKIKKQEQIIIEQEEAEQKIQARLIETEDQLAEEQARSETSLERNEKFNDEIEVLTMEKERNELEIEQLKVEIADLKEIGQSNEEIDELKTKLEAIENQKAELEKGHAEKDFNLEELKKKEAEIKAHLLQTQDEKAKETEKMAEDLKQAQLAKDENERLIQEQIKKHEHEKKEEQEKAQATIQEHLSQAEAEKADFQQKMDEHKQFQEQAQKEQDDYQSKIAESEKLIKDHEASLDEHKKQGEELVKQVQDAKDHIENTKKENERQITVFKQENNDLLQQITDSEAALEQMKNKESELNNQASSGQAELMQQLNDFKIKHSELESKVKDGESQKSQMEKGKFLLTALQLKCKKLISEKLQKQRQEAQELRHQLQEHQEQQDSVFEKAQKLKDELEKKQAQHNDELNESAQQKEEIQRNSLIQKEQFENYRDQLKNQMQDHQNQRKTDEEKLLLEHQQNVGEKDVLISDLQEQLSLAELATEQAKGQLAKFEEILNNKDEGQDKIIEKLKEHEALIFAKDQDHAQTQKMLQEHQDLLAKQDEEHSLTQNTLKEHQELLSQKEQEYLEAQESLKEHQNQLNQEQIQHLEAQSKLQEYKDMLAQKENDHSELQAKLIEHESLRENHNEVQNKLKDHQESLNALKEENVNLQQNHEELNAKHDTATSQLDIHKTILSKKQIELEQTNQSHQEALDKLNEQQQEIDDFNVQISDLKTEQDSKTAQLDQHKADLEQHKAELDELITEKQQIQLELDIHKEELDNHQNQLIQAQTELDQHISELDQHKTDKEKLQSDLDQHKSEIDNHLNDKNSLTKENANTQEILNDEIEKNQKLSAKLAEAQLQLEKLEANEKELKEKLDSAHNEVGAKVDTGHDNVKKIVDMHKTNEDLTAQLMAKTDHTTQLNDKINEHKDEIESHKKKVQDLKQDADDQSTAYDVLLDQISEHEQQEATLKKDNAVLEKQSLDLNDQCEKMTTKIKELEETVKKATNRASRGNSMGSDDDYHSVQDMRDNLKHANAMLISFIQKLPYSSPENEATLPIIYSMFEFTKQEQNQVTEARQSKNQAAMQTEVKDKSKKLFGTMFKNAKDKGKAARPGLNTQGNTSFQSSSREESNKNTK